MVIPFGNVMRKEKRANAFDSLLRGVVAFKAICTSRVRLAVVWDPLWAKEEQDVS